MDRKGREDENRKVFRYTCVSQFDETDEGGRGQSNEIVGRKGRKKWDQGWMKEGKGDRRVMQVTGR